VTPSTLVSVSVRRANPGMVTDPKLACCADSERCRAGRG
jgi:hypothetical protein